MQEKFFRKNLKFNLFLFIIAFFFLINFYLPLYFRWKKFKEEEKRLLTKIRKLQKEVYILEKNLESLKSNSHLLEKLVREKLGFVKKDELIVDIRR